MVEPQAPSAPRIPETRPDHSQLTQICADKLNPFLNSGRPRRGPSRRHKGGNEEWRALWGGSVWGEADESGAIRRGVRIRPDHGVYNISNSLKKGVWEIRFCSDSEVTVKQALERALIEGGNVIREYAEGEEPNRNQPNNVHLFADGTGFLYEYRFEHGLYISQGPNKGKEFLGFGSPLSQELSTKLAEEITRFEVIKK